MAYFVNFKLMYHLLPHISAVVMMVWVYNGFTFVVLTKTHKYNLHRYICIHSKKEMYNN